MNSFNAAFSLPTYFNDKRGCFQHFKCVHVSNNVTARNIVAHLGSTTKSCSYNIDRAEETLQRK